MGRIGVHHPREIVRVERDYTGGEIVQFSSVYPMELEGRVSLFFFFFANLQCHASLLVFLYIFMQITPRQFMESINAINEILISAYSLWRSVFDNGVEIFSLQLSRLVISTHYERVCFFVSGRVNRGSHGFCSGDEAVTASYRRLEPPAFQPRRTEHALAKKSRVSICESASSAI
jgi:hypothetical protein